MSDSTVRQTIGVLRESAPGETRVALTPAVVPELAKAGFAVCVEAGAGAAAGYPDASYSERGAKLLSDRSSVLAQSQIVVRVDRPGPIPPGRSATCSRCLRARR